MLSQNGSMNSQTSSQNSFSGINSQKIIPTTGRSSISFPVPNSHAEPSASRLSHFNSHRKTLHIPNNPMNENDEELEVVWKGSALVDNFIIELISSILVCLSVIFSWDWNGDNFALQFIPGICLGLIMLCIKDEDYFFPDGSPMVTLMVWLMGGYFSWVQSVVRIMAHCVGFAISLWICTSAPIPKMIYHRQYSNAVYFAMEALTTSIEHIAIVYVVMPLLPPSNKKGTTFLFPPVKPKSHPDTMAPSNSVVMNSAIIFSVIHWVFWQMLSCEMNPSVLLLLTYLRVFQTGKGYNLNDYANNPNQINSANDHWNYGLMGVWGQCVGLFVSLLYAYFFIPRSHKFKILNQYTTYNKRNSKF